MVGALAASVVGEMFFDHARAQSRRVVDVSLAVNDGHALLPKRS